MILLTESERQQIADDYRKASKYNEECGNHEAAIEYGWWSSMYGYTGDDLDIPVEVELEVNP